MVVTLEVEVVHMVVPLGYEMEIGSVCLYVCVSHTPNPPMSGAREDCSYGNASSCLARCTHTCMHRHTYTLK